MTELKIIFSLLLNICYQFAKFQIITASTNKKVAALPAHSVGYLLREY